MQTTYRHAYKVKLFGSDQYHSHTHLTDWCDENLERDYYVTSFWDAKRRKCGTLWFFESEDEAMWFKLANNEGT